MVWIYNRIVINIGFYVCKTIQVPAIQVSSLSVITKDKSENSPCKFLFSPSSDPGILECKFTLNCKLLFILYKTSVIMLLEMKEMK